MHGANVIRVDAAGLKAELETLEHAYGMSSEEFLRRWRAGDEALHKHEYFAWAGLCHMAARAGIIDTASLDAITA